MFAPTRWRCLWAAVAIEVVRCSIEQGQRERPKRIATLRSWGQCHGPPALGATSGCGHRRSGRLARREARARVSTLAARERFDASDQESLNIHGVLWDGPSVKYAFIDRQRTHHPVHRLCKLLEVSSVGYYEWRGQPYSSRSSEDERCERRSCAARGKPQDLRRPQIHAELCEEGLESWIELDREVDETSGIQSDRARRFVRTTVPGHSHPTL